MAAPRAREAGDVQELTIRAENFGYAPALAVARSGVPVRLSVTTDNTTGCTRLFTIPSLNVQEVLPQTGVVTFDLPALPQGDLVFSCGMGMYGGVIRVEG